MTKVEFIESYIKVGNDYQWHDNHGELIRCEECKHYTALGKNGLWGRCSLHASRVETARTCQSVDYCSWAEREEE